VLGIGGRTADFVLLRCGMLVRRGGLRVSSLHRTCDYDIFFQKISVAEPESSLCTKIKCPPFGEHLILVALVESNWNLLFDELSRWNLQNSCGLSSSLRNCFNIGWQNTVTG
jgi:hypothetical protein